MYKTALRAAPRRIAACRPFVNNTRRFINTAPPAQKSRSLKSSLARWGLAGGIVYFYINNDLFANEPEAAIQSLDESIHHVQESKLQTVDAIVEEKRLREAQQAEENKRTEGNVERAAITEGEDTEGEGEGGMGGLEDEAGQQGAFNPETGEINWDCPCLGGMAHGPCGEEFREAFSCFVHSTEEPKGVECIEKFKGMQDCFRAHPEMYGSELEEDEDDLEEEIRAQEAQRAEGGPELTNQKSELKETESPAKSAPEQIAVDSAPKSEKEAPVKEDAPSAEPKVLETSEDSKALPKTEPKTSETPEGDSEAVPKAAYDASSK